MTAAFPLADRQPLQVNGRNLAELSALFESLAPLSTIPARRGANIVVPGRHGDIRVPNKPYTAADFVLSVLVRGSLPDGAIPPGSSEREELYARVAELTDLFCVGETVRLQFTRPDSSVRVCDAEVSAAVTVARDFTQRPTIGRLAVAFTVPAGFWFDPAPVTSQVSFATSGQVVGLWEFHGATAPMTDVEITVGEAWNPVVADAATGGWVAYDAVILPGQALRIDGAARRVYGDGGLVVDQGLVRRGGVRNRLFELSPGRPPAISVTSTGPGPVPVQVAGRRAYLTA